MFKLKNIPDGLKEKMKSVRVKDLVPYENNAKIHSKKQIKDLVRSIKNNGYFNPIVIHKKNVIISGHGRHSALMEIDPEQPVEVVDMSYLSDEQADKLRILDNKVVSDEWDLDKLSGEIDKLFDFSDINEIAESLSMDKKEVDRLRPSPETSGDDDIPIDVKAISKPGDHWELGKHHVFCGDFIEIDIPLRPTLVFTDPPYGVSYEQGKFTGSKVKKKFDAIHGDDMRGEQLMNFITSIFSKAKSICDDDCVFYCMAPSMMESYSILMGLMNAGIKVQSEIIWNKNRFILGRCDYHWKHEKCWYGFTGKNHYWNGWRNQGSVWDISRDGNYKHPTQKPVELAERAILNSSKSGEVVLDMFLGSGSTLIACEKNSRICVGTDIEPKYCDVVRDRYIDFCLGNDIDFQVKLNGEPWVRGNT